MTRRHTVQEGESVSQLAERYGLFAVTIWQDPENADLRARRKNMNVLLPGDVVAIPEKRTKEVSIAAGRRHRFKRKGVPALVRLRLLRFGEPRARQSYTLTVDGKELGGTTDDEGVLEQYVSPQAREAILVIGEDRFTARLSFGRVHPISETSGVRRRLRNLGYPVDPDGDLDDAARRAIALFQRDRGLPETGDPDDATRSALEAEHDRAARTSGG